MFLYDRRDFCALFYPLQLTEGRDKMVFDVMAVNNTKLYNDGIYL